MKIKHLQRLKQERQNKDSNIRILLKKINAHLRMGIFFAIKWFFAYQFPIQLRTLSLKYFNKKESHLVIELNLLIINI